jgi:hypothetical protein
MARNGPWFEPCVRRWPSSSFAFQAAAGSQSVAGQELASQLKVGLGTPRAGIVECHGLAVAGSLSQADVTRNHGLIEAVRKYSRSVSVTC